MMLMRVNRCCCCIKDLKTATFVIIALCMKATVVYLGLSIYSANLLATGEYYRLLARSTTPVIPEAIRTCILTILVPWLLLWLIANILLLLGNLKERPGLFLPWQFLAILGMIVITVAFVGQLVAMSFIVRLQNDETSKVIAHIGAHAQFWVSMWWSYYWLSVVNSRRLDIAEKRPEDKIKLTEVGLSSSTTSFENPLPANFVKSA